MKKALRTSLLTAAVFSASPMFWGRAALDARVAPRLSKVRQDQLPASILALDLAADSHLAAAALSDGHVRVWQLETGAIARDLTFPEPETDPRQKNDSEVEPIRVRFAPNGKILAVSHLSRIYLFDTASWQQVGSSLGVQGEDVMRPIPVPTLTRRPEHEEPRPELTLNQMAQDWLKLRLTGDGRTRITDFAFTLDGSHILAAYCRGSCYDRPGSWNSTNPGGKDPVRLWDVRSGRLAWEHIYDPKAVIQRVMPSPGGKLFAAAKEQPGWCTVQVHDLQSGERLYSLPGVRAFADTAPSILFTPDGKELITFWAGPGTRKFRPWEHFAIYDVKDGRMVAELQGRIGACDADISANGHWLVAPTLNLITFMIYDVQTRHVVAVVRRQFPWGWRGPGVDRVRFDPAGRYLVVANRKSGKVAIYQFD